MRGKTGEKSWRGQHWLLKKLFTVSRESDKKLSRIYRDMESV